MSKPKGKHHRLLTNRESIPAGKWLHGMTRDMTYREAAELGLHARLATIAHWLPLAAEHPERDIEYVHQLRVASRRFNATLRVFRSLISTELYKSIRKFASKARQCAGKARDCDVLTQRLIMQQNQQDHDANHLKWMVRELNRQRQTAQKPLIKLHKKYPTERLAELRNRLIDDLQRPSGSRKQARTLFVRQIPRILDKKVQRFVDASQADLDDLSLLHQFRIAGKRLRYAMEIVAPMLPKPVRKELYGQLCELQTFLGTINDADNSARLFYDWSTRCDSKPRSHYLLGLYTAQQLMLSDLHDLFMICWPHQRIKELVLKPHIGFSGNSTALTGRHHDPTGKQRPRTSAASA